MSNRIEKVNSLLEHELSAIMARDFNFPNTLVTLTHVDATPNLIEAKAYVSILPSAAALSSGVTMDDKADQIIRALNNNVYDVQQKINKKLNMRPIPKIKFVKDGHIAEAARIEELLEILKKDKK